MHPDQWLYLPALKRVKRISSSRQSGSFMGSEFSYEDLGAVEVEKFTHRYLRDESCGDLECSVLERIPISRDSGYSRQLVWLDQEELRTIQIQYFNRREELLKTMVVEDYEKYLDRFWRSGKTTMTSHLTGKSTELLWSDYEFQTDLDVGDFTNTALRRVRYSLARFGSSCPPTSSTGSRPEWGGSEPESGRHPCGSMGTDRDPGPSLGLDRQR